MTLRLEIAPINSNSNICRKLSIEQPTLATSYSLPNSFNAVLLIKTAADGAFKTQTFS